MKRSNNLLYALLMFCLGVFAVISLGAFIFMLGQIPNTQHSSDVMTQADAVRSTTDDGLDSLAKGDGATMLRSHLTTASERAKILAAMKPVDELVELHLLDGNKNLGDDVKLLDNAANTLGYTSNDSFDKGKKDARLALERVREKARKIFGEQATYTRDKLRQFSFIALFILTLLGIFGILSSLAAFFWLRARRYEEVRTREITRALPDATPAGPCTTCASLRGDIDTARLRITSLEAEIDRLRNLPAPAPIYIPAPVAAIAPPPPPAPEPVAPPAPRPAPAGIAGNVMVVQADDRVRPLVVQNLRNAGAHVESFTDGESAFEVYRAAPDRWAAAVIDANLPGLDGVSLLRRMRKLNDAQRAVVLVDEGDNAEGIQQHGTAVVEKPMTMAQLRDALARCTA